MAERIQRSALPVLSSQELHQAEIEQSKPTVQGILPASLAPLPTAEQHQIIGGIGGGSDQLRLEMPGAFQSAHLQMTQVGQILKRMKEPISEHPFLGMESKAVSVLENHYQNLRQILSRLTWKN